MLGILLVNHLYTHILFDYGITHSFINPKFAKKHTDKPDEMDIQLYVTTPLWTNYHTDLTIRDYAIKVKSRTLPADLVQIEIQRWNVILGVDWLAKHKVTLDCEKKLITFSTPEGERIP